ncbi:Uma2 family endonuclease [Kitasatospora sp. NA04385]|uniref:Uma2 family endonuclease n=1 Tax=Kitasatospora sp. NA04385 TaxID=2742135 RepID=UPI001590F098|nr:Uma2 family endonuclease [Kitasatospora sp. NA04385]QKW22121.1 Uma2 family endonuclease [Kitasatospora sp. NA04385]
MAVMTTERPQMELEQFRNIAAIAAEREDVVFEFINGRIGVKPVPDGDHGEIIRWVSRRCMQHRPDLWLYVEQGLRVDRYRAGHAKPDGALAEDGAFAGQGEWADPEQVLMVVEVTSYDSDTHRRDRVEKPVAYAEAGIPVYLLIDRDAGAVTVHSDPQGGRYETVTTRAYGHEVVLPDPVGVLLDTEELKRYAR